MRQPGLCGMLTTTTILISTALGSSLFGQAALPPLTLDTAMDKTAREVYESFLPTVPKGQEAKTASQTLKSVVTSNVAITPPDPFASRVHSSYQDFLNFFNFGIDKVDEAQNGQSLVIRFNPLKDRTQMLSPSLTVTKPTLFDGITNAIPEAQRSAATQKLQGQLGDLDDLTWSLSYSYATAQNQCIWDGRWCWGRNTSTYRQMLSESLAEVFHPGESVTQKRLMSELASELSPGTSVFAKKIREFKDPAGTFQRIQSLAAQDAAAISALVVPEGIDKLSSLIDNQPQLAITGSYHDVTHLLGPNETQVSAEFQVGPDNVNALKRNCGKSNEDESRACFIKQLKAYAATGVSTDKVVLTAGFKERSAYHLDQVVVGTPVVGFTPIELKRSTEITAKAQWGRKLGAKIGQKETRFDLSADGTWTRDDPLRTKSRVVGTATITLPLGDQVSVPFSLNYANRPEFLTGQRKQLGAHLGLTYRLPWDKSTTSTP